MAGGGYALDAWLSPPLTPAGRASAACGCGALNLLVVWSDPVAPPGRPRAPARGVSVAGDHQRAATLQVSFKGTKQLVWTIA
jgi:hypothetical protein